MADNDLTVDGFTFENEDDVKIAKAELNRIAQLEGKIDHKNPHLVMAVYEKAISNNLFKTPVGICYLKKLQDEIKKSPLIQKEVVDIPVSFITEEKLSKEVNRGIRRDRLKNAKSKERFTKKASIALNITLAIVIVILFAITLSSSSPNILNYEYNLQNKYASWNEELNAREQVIREKEKELNVH